MRAVQIRGTAKKIQQLVQLGKQALRDGAIGWLTGFTPWLSIWRAEPLPKLLMSLKFIALMFACGWSAGKLMGWREFWKDTAPAVRPLSLSANASSWPTSWSPARWLMALAPASGLAR